MAISEFEHKQLALVTQKGMGVYNQRTPTKIGSPALSLSQNFGAHLFTYVRKDQYANAIII